MKLKWQAVNKVWDGEWEAEGEMGRSYLVESTEGDPRQFRVMQMRQRGGQIIRVAVTNCLEGAFARAQVWENG